MNMAPNVLHVVHLFVDDFILALVTKSHNVIHFIHFVSVIVLKFLILGKGGGR